MNAKRKQEARERIVIAFVSASPEATIADGEAFDEIVCSALGIDQKKNPPEFMIDAMMLGL